MANIILTGFMGTGKTTVGKLLAAQLGYAFVDTDQIIEEQAKRSIPRIFAELGEAAFRQIECDVAKQLAERDQLIISTGGGMMLDPANVAELSRTGRIFCLVATPEEILSRITGDDEHVRPLLEVQNPGERIVEILSQREQKYRRFPQVRTTDKQPNEVARDLLTLIDGDPKRYTIDHPVRGYEYIVGGGLLPFLRQLVTIEGKLVVITDERVGALYLPSLGEVDCVVTLPIGRNQKTLTTIQQVCEQLVDTGIDRHTTIVALGGSMVGDIAGFVAAIYMRGVNLIHCPTSLLAMVDTSIGGKTGIDLSQGKNLLGCYKQPRAVIADIATLQTLPPAEFASGMAEVIKHGLLADTDLLHQVEKGDWQLDAGYVPLADFQVLVAQAIQVKINIVQTDPFEQDTRSILNLGHTFAHAIEQVSKQMIRHGEAVAMGLVAAAELSCRLGHCSAELQPHIEQALTKIGLPTRIPANLSHQAIFAAMVRDKKRRAGKMRFVLLHNVGAAFVTDDVSEAAVLATLQTVQEE